MYTQIKTLSSWHKNDILMQAKVTHINCFKTKTEKLIMNIIIQDMHGSDIHVLFWNDLVKKFKKEIKLYQTYEFSKFNIQRIKNQLYNKTNHKYKINVTSETIIKKVIPSFIVDDGDKKVNCIKLKKKINNKVKTNKKKITIKEFYNITNPQKTIIDFFEPKSKKKKIMNNQKIKNNEIKNKNADEIMQPIITNFFNVIKQ